MLQIQPSCMIRNMLLFFMALDNFFIILEFFSKLTSECPCHNNRVLLKGPAWQSWRRCGDHMEIPLHNVCILRMSIFYVTWDQVRPSDSEIGHLKIFGPPNPSSFRGHNAAIFLLIILCPSTQWPLGFPPNFRLRRRLLVEIIERCLKISQNPRVFFRHM